MPAGSAAVEASELAELASALIHTRRSMPPKYLREPGPSAVELDALMNAAAAAPDHGEIVPWRFIVVPQEQRAHLGEVFALALVDRDPAATPKQREAARAKAHHAPLLMLAVARLGPADPDIPPLERVLSLGCALQNILLFAHALGYGAGLVAGRALASQRLRELFALAPSEQPLCFVGVGTATVARPPGRLRPTPDQILSRL
jgi:nitroreductase